MKTQKRIAMVGILAAFAIILAVTTATTEVPPAEAQIGIITFEV